jgi:hypothetical protein
VKALVLSIVRTRHFEWIVVAGWELDQIKRG